MCWRSTGMVRTTPGSWRNCELQKAWTALADNEAISAVIPMGINVATMSRGNVLELKLNEWAKQMFTGSLEKRRADIADIKTLVDELNVDLTHQHALAAPERKAQLDIVLKDIQQLTDEQLWENGHQQPTALLERLETKIAPFAGDAKVVSSATLEPT